MKTINNKFTFPKTLKLQRPFAENKITVDEVKSKVLI